MSVEPGDPAATSALGGALRSQALELAGLYGRLEPPGGGRVPIGSPGPRWPASPDGDPPTAHELALLAGAAEQLDRVGAALQGLVSGGVERSARYRSLAAEADRQDLQLDGYRVIERPGPSRVDPAARLRSRNRLQERLTRLAAARGRELAGLSRELESSIAALADLSERARDGPS